RSFSVKCPTFSPSTAVRPFAASAAERAWARDRTASTSGTRFGTGHLRGNELSLTEPIRGRQPAIGYTFADGRGHERRAGAGAAGGRRARGGGGRLRRGDGAHPDRQPARRALRGLRAAHRRDAEGPGLRDRVPRRGGRGRAHGRASSAERD